MTTSATKFLGLALASVALAATPLISAGTTLTGGAQRTLGASVPRRVDIRVDLRPDVPTALIEADLKFSVALQTDSVVVFLRPDMDLDMVADEAGTPLDFRRRNDIVRVSTPPLEPGVETSWHFRYRARFDRPLEESGQILLSTPWYPHFRRPPTPGEFTRYLPMAMTLRAALPRPWVLVSSGTNRVSRNDQGTVDYIWSDSVPTNQIPLVIGRFEERNELRPVGYLRGFFPEEDKSAARSYVDYMGTVATYFSDRIGTLPRRSWNLVAVDLRENLSGVTVPGVTFIEVDDVDPRGTFPYRVLAHEIAHHWWNHGIKIPRVRDGWLREGLPTYSSLLFLENQYGTQLMRRELELSRAIALAVDSEEPLATGFEMETDEAIYAFNYHKAAVVLHMLREVMGLDGFSRLLRALFDFGGDVTTEVFVRISSEIQGEDLSWFFTPWLTTADVPSFDIRYSVREAEGAAFRFELFGTVTQRDAAVRYPVLVRIPLEAAPPLETTVWVEPGVADFTIVLPSPPRTLEFDPEGDFFYREVTIERVGEARPASGER